VTLKNRRRTKRKIKSGIQNALNGVRDYVANRLGFDASNASVQEGHIGVKVSVKLGPYSGEFGPELVLGNDDSFNDLMFGARFKAAWKLSNNDLSKQSDGTIAGNLVGTGLNVKVYGGVDISDKGTVVNGTKISQTVCASFVRKTIKVGGKNIIGPRGGDIITGQGGSDWKMDTTKKN
jgi:hypothetical protein